MITFPIPPRELARQKALRDRLYKLLASDYQIEELRFMNYGFLPGPDQDSQMSHIPLDASEENYRSQIQLYDHLVRKVNLAGKNVLEVGCGRGGGARYITRYVRPASYTGVDLTPGAVGYAAKANPQSSCAFLVGQAERLPFRDSVFDVVINVESSHCYDPIGSFLAEVRRTLVPGGYLLLTDFRDLMTLDELRRALTQCGMNVLEEKNISSNVFEAIKAESPKRAEAIIRHAPQKLWPVLNEFAAVKGSGFFYALEEGEAKYMTYVLQRPEEPGA